MCDRYTHLFTWHQLAELYKLTSSLGAPANFQPNHYVAPGQKAPVVRIRNGERELVMLHWGLIPHWAKNVKIGCKTKYGFDKSSVPGPAYRTAWRTRRCLIPASGYYEWSQVPGRKQKQSYLIAFRDRRPFSLAGLWESSTDPMNDEVLDSYTILTGPPNEVAAEIKNRMPVIIDPADHMRWLTATEPPTDLLRPHSAAGMTAHEISTEVNVASRAKASLSLWRAS